MIHVLNQTIKEIAPEAREKKIHVQSEAKNTFPSYLSSLHSIELDESKQKTVQILSYPTSIIYRNFDLFNQEPHTWNTKHAIFSNVRFPEKKPGSQKFPQCLVMKLDRPRGIEGIDFSSFKSLRKLEVTYGDGSKADVAAQITTLFGLLKNVPSLKLMRLNLSSLDIVTFTALVIDNCQRYNIERLLEFQVD